MIDAIGRHGETTSYPTPEELEEIRSCSDKELLAYIHNPPVQENHPLNTFDLYKTGYRIGAVTELCNRVCSEETPQYLQRMIVRYHLIKTVADHSLSQLKLAEHQDNISRTIFGAGWGFRKLRSVRKDVRRWRKNHEEDTERLQEETAYAKDIGLPLMLEEQLEYF